MRAGSARPARLVLRSLAVTAALLAVLAALVGLAFAGSPARLAEGVTIAGVDVGGMTRAQARRTLEARAAKVANVPVVFTVGEREFPVKAASLDVRADWAAAVASAAEEGEGFGPVRGYRRLQTRFFGAEIVPPIRAYEAALDYKLAGMAREVDRPHVEAKIVRRGLQIVVVPGQTGLRLDRDAAADVMVRALARLDRGGPVALPVRLDPVEVTAAELGPAARQARVAVSAPVVLEYEGTRWRLPRWRIAELLTLPADGQTGLAIGGEAADAWFAKLRRTVERPPT
ncbi:MAG TPA: peptidoglycan binding domain-containing protein, partial [Gaiellaceae bacterium]|nr:peptidoglycan binding domain-containing protein [Gaiellaceae bacterium]